MENDIKEGRFVEYVKNYGNYYGTRLRAACVLYDVPVSNNKNNNTTIIKIKNKNTITAVFILLQQKQ